MSGLSIHDTPFKAEVGAVTSRGGSSPCFSFDLEFIIGGIAYRPYTITGIDEINDFIGDYYPILAVTFQTSIAIKEKMIEASASIEAILKRYEIGRETPYNVQALRNPTMTRYKAKLYVEESDHVSQNNPAINNEDYTANKTMVEVKVQLVEAGFEKLAARHVGGNYNNISGSKLIRHLVDFHANRDNDDVASMLTGVDMAPSSNEEVRSYILLEHGTSLVEAMHSINQNCGGIYPTGFSYFIHRNTWYVFPPYALKRFTENRQKLVVVNLPKNRVPGLERTYDITPSLITVLATRDVTITDKRESKKVSFGTGVSFGDASKLMDGFANVMNNKLLVDGSTNVNDLLVSERSDDINQIRFAKDKLTSAKNLELSKFAPSKGFVMMIAWENSISGVIYPGMPVRVLYLVKNRPRTVEGSVIGIRTVYYPYEDSFPARKFGTLTYLEVFVGEVTEGDQRTSQNVNMSSAASMGVQADDVSILTASRRPVGGSDII